MNINPDGTFHLQKGEPVPYVCPKDGWPIPFEENLAMVRCFHCGYIGEPSEFSPDIELVKTDEAANKHEL